MFAAVQLPPSADTPGRPGHAKALHASEARLPVLVTDKTGAGKEVAAPALRELGVNAGQGHLLARPMPAEQAYTLITLQRSEPH